MWTPAAFCRRGIYLDRHDLTHDAVTPMPEPLFDRTDIRRAVEALAASLERRRVIGDVHVYGGAAMILAYNPHRTATCDIASQFWLDGPMIAAIRETANEYGWPTTWLNNQASGYVARHPGEGDRVFDHPHLQVSVTPAPICRSRERNGKLLETPLRCSARSGRTSRSTTDTDP